MLATLLLTIPSFLFNPTFYFWLFGFIFSIFVYFHKLYLDRLKEGAIEAKKERDELNTKFDKLDRRIGVAENIDNIAYPKLQKLETDFFSLTETVKNHHENRFTGIVLDIGSLRDNIDLRFKSTEKDIADIKKGFDKLEVKFDKLSEEIKVSNTALLTQIMKMNEKK